MRRAAAAVLAILAIATAAPAGAQTGPVRVLAPGGAASISGISVPGRGVVRRPADTVRFTIFLGNRGAASSVLPGANALVAALRQNGIADAAIGEPLGGMVSAQGTVTVVGSLRKPTLDKLRAVIAGATQALPPDGVPIQNITYALALDDCSDAEAAATRAAMDDARARAEDFAAAAHVQLGGIIAITVQTAAPQQCPTKPDGVPMPGGQPYEPFAAPAFDVIVPVSATVTYAIH